jgi:hypothetical protein
MITYAIKILSNTHHKELKEEILRSVLSCPTMSVLLFPATLVRKKDRVTIQGVNQFRLSLIPNEMKRDQFITVNLAGQSGLQFSARIHCIDTIFADSLQIRFSQSILRDNTISFPMLKSLLEEIIPVFRASHASLFDVGILKRENRPINFPKTRYPYGIDWITYFGPDMIEYLGRERFDQLKSVHDKYELNRGIMVILQEEPYVESNAQHRARQEKAEAEIGFPELVASSD